MDLASFGITMQMREIEVSLDVILPAYAKPTYQSRSAIEKMLVNGKLYLTLPVSQGFRLYLLFSLSLVM
jgi:hypothetical protein